MCEKGIKIGVKTQVKSAILLRILLPGSFFKMKYSKCLAGNIWSATKKEIRRNGYRFRGRHWHGISDLIFYFVSLSLIFEILLG